MGQIANQMLTEMLEKLAGKIGRKREKQDEAQANTGRTAAKLKEKENKR